LVFELQLLFDAAITKELMDDLCSVNMPQAQKYTWKTNYTLGGEEIHGEQIEPSLNFVHPCIGKL